MTVNAHVVDRDGTGRSSDRSRLVSYHFYTGPDWQPRLPSGQIWSRDDYDVPMPGSVEGK